MVWHIEGAKDVFQKKPPEAKEAADGNIVIPLYFYTVLQTAICSASVAHVLNEDDLKMVDLFVEELHRHYCTAGLIARSLHERGRGEPEGSPLH